MPFLFIDYDQGAGGELFAAKLSESDQCVTLEYDQFSNGRTKTYDKFNQEFLNNPCQVDYTLKSHDTLYDIVLSHSNTALAKKILDNVLSLRISMPDIDNPMHKFCQHQKLHKVLLSKLPSKIFPGEIKFLTRNSINPNFLRQINSQMDYLDLLLISQNISPNKQSRNEYIETVMKTPSVEPDFNFDLVISYRDLIYDMEKVKLSILDCFGIIVKGDWLDNYRKTYETWLSQT